VIVASQGGMQSATKKLAELRQASVSLAGFWIQDWVGIRVTSAGQQLWWDWRLNENYYPQWRELVADLEKDGARMLIYINPFLSNAAGHDALFEEAQANGYLVKKADGSPYLIKNTVFFAALIDLSNPATRTWIKGIIKTEFIGKAGASGWMADFGEALPFDAKLHGNADPAVWHNRFTEEWAKVHREAIEEAGRFLLGPDLLVAPVLDPGVDALDVSFPVRSEWTDLWSGADGGLEPRAGAVVKTCRVPPQGRCVRR
jgi:alpha-glucosidase